MNALALTGFARRMRVYLAEMYPVPERLALAVLVYVAIAAFASHIHHVPFDLASPATAAAICAGNFTRAHRVLGRVRARRETPLRSARFAGQPRAIRMEEGN